MKALYKMDNCEICEPLNMKFPIYFLRKEQPSVSLAFPPVGWQRTVAQPAQITTV